MISEKETSMRKSYAVWVLIAGLCSAMTVNAEDYMAIPKNIETFNVPPVPQNTASRLQQYANSHNGFRSVL